MKLKLLSLLLFSFLIQNCSNSKYFTPASSVKNNFQKEISDDAIKKALEAKAQLTKPVTIALYGGGSSIKGLADSLKKIDLVKDVFEISPGLIEGDSYYRRSGNMWYDYYNAPVSTNIDQLRLTAAQGKSDLLIYCGVGHKYRSTPNFLSSSYVLLLTVLFVPGQDVELISNVDLFCIDVRNGFLYGTYSGKEIFKKDYVTLSYDRNIDSIKDKQTDKMVPSLLKYVKKLLSREEIYIK